MNNKVIIFLTFFLLLATTCSNVGSRTVKEIEKPPINSRKLEELDSLLEACVRDSCYPGYVLLAVQGGRPYYYKSGGKMSYDSNAKPMKKNSIFDMASVTKVVATTSAIMVLYDEGKIGLDDKVIKYLPEFGEKGKDQITIRDLLTHTSGLPAWHHLWSEGRGPEVSVKNLYNLEFAYKTGEKTVYSCMGFITLGKIVEAITDMPLDKFVTEKVYHPLNMKHTFFNPPEKYYPRIPPTEFDSARGGIVHGKVHDENAYYLGGVSGNAGLFSTAEDLSIFCQMMLNKGTYNGKRIFKSTTVELFTQRQNIVTGSSRCLGWDSPSGQSSSGQYFSDDSYGHTGFTGTSIWIDPQKQMYGIYLTNRVHPTRNNRKMYKTRYQVYNLLQETLAQFPLTKNSKVDY
jgi:CubicO group peptidase (beta-lactamase class C family)